MLKFCRRAADSTSVVLEIPQRLSRQLEAVAKARNVNVDRWVLGELKALIPRPSAKKGQKPALVDLDWMDGYSGQTADELLAFEHHERIDLLAAAFEEGIRERIQRTGSWNGVERTNTSRRHALAIVDDLERVGCRAIGNIARKAADALGLRHLTSQGIETVMNTQDQKRTRIFAQCDIAFYKRGEIPKRVIAYIKANRGGIRF